MTLSNNPILNGIVAGGLRADEPPAADVKKGTTFALLAVLAGVVLAVVVSFVSWNVSIPGYIIALPGIVAGYGSVWLYLKKVSHVSKKGLVRLIALAVVSFVLILAASAGTDVFYITSHGGGAFIMDIFRENLTWYLVLVVGTLVGTAGALRTCKERG